MKYPRRITDIISKENILALYNEHTTDHVWHNCSTTFYVQKVNNPCVFSPYSDITEIVKDVWNGKGVSAYNGRWIKGYIESWDNVHNTDLEKTHFIGMLHFLLEWNPKFYK